jgi:hypothetical protein
MGLIANSQTLQFVAEFSANGIQWNSVELFMNPKD